MITRGQFILSQTVAPVLQKSAYMPALLWLKAAPWWKKLIIGTAAAPTVAKGIEVVTPDYPEGKEKKAVSVMQEEQAQEPKKTDQELLELNAPPQPVNKAEHVEVPPPQNVMQIPGTNQPDTMTMPPEDMAKSVYAIQPPKVAGYQLMRHADATAQLLNTCK